MPLAIFGIDNTGINLGVTFLILALIAIWIALIVFTFSDARRRISDPFLIGCATAASFFPYVGTIVYTILRPPEFLDDVNERETEMKSSETRLRHLNAHSCRKCGFPTEADFVRCPACRTRLKEACPSCDRPVGLKWKVCPYCEHTLIESKRSRSSSKAAAKDPEARPEPDGRRRRREPEASDGEAAPERAGAPARRSGRRAARSDTAKRDESRDRQKSSGSGARSESGGEPVAGESSDSSDRPARSATRRRTKVSEDDLPPTRTINSGESDRPGSSRDSD